MNNQDDNKPVTLEDYIPPAPKPKRASRRLTRKDRDRLDALERSVKDPDDRKRSNHKKRRKKDGWKQPPSRRSSGMMKLVFWALVILFIVAFVLD